MLEKALKKPSKTWLNQCIEKVLEKHERSDPAPTPFWFFCSITMVVGSLLVMSYVSPHEWIEPIKGLEIALNPIGCVGFRFFCFSKDIIGNMLKLAYIF